MLHLNWRQRLAVGGLALLALFSCTTTAPVFADTAAPAAGNLALNKPVTASSVEKNGYEAKSAVDGDLKTRWASVQGIDPQWISVDLGATYNITSVRIVWQNAYAKAYTIQTSNDGATWDDIYKTTTGSSGVNTIPNLTGAGRWVRINGTVRGTKHGYSLYEFEVYGSLTAPAAAPAAAANLGTAKIAINCGGPATGSFIADKYFDNGTDASNNTGKVDVSGVVNPAPAAVYQTERWGDFTYTIPGMTPNAAYKVRLHFTEDFVTTPGDRVFNVTVNGKAALTNFDIYAAAGAENKAVIKDIDTTADKDGKIAIAFVSVTQNAKVDGIEIY